MEQELLQKFSFVKNEFRDDILELWNSPLWQEKLNDFEIYRKTKNRQCLARTGTGEQCSLSSKNNDDFCGLHGKYTTPKLCLECTRFYSKSIYHTYKWEHNGRIDKNITPHIQKRNLPPKRCLAYVKRSFKEVEKDTQCCHNASVCLGKDGWFCKLHVKQNYTHKKCQKCSIVHQYAWECNGRVDKRETLRNNISKLSPNKFEKLVERRIDLYLSKRKKHENLHRCTEGESDTDIDIETDIETDVEDNDLLKE